MPLPARFSVNFETQTPQVPGAVIIGLGNIAVRLTIDEAEAHGRSVLDAALRARGTDPATGMSLPRP